MSEPAPAPAAPFPPSMATGFPPPGFFIIYVTHSTRILLVDCFAYTCSFSFLAPLHIYQFLGPPSDFLGCGKGVAEAPLSDSPRRANIMNGN